VVTDAPEMTEVAEPIRTSRPAATSSATGRRSAASAPVRRRLAETAVDYSYVRRDLRTIAVIATILVVALVVLSFVVR
jgi:hypothetical protein